MRFLTVSGAARQISARQRVTIAPHLISDLFYKRLLDDQKCPVLGGRRVIPSDYLPQIEKVLGQRGVFDSPCAPLDSTPERDRDGRDDCDGCARY